MRIVPIKEASHRLTNVASASTHRTAFLKFFTLYEKIWLENYFIAPVRYSLRVYSCWTHLLIGSSSLPSMIRMAWASAESQYDILWFVPHVMYWLSSVRHMVKVRDKERSKVRDKERSKVRDKERSKVRDTWTVRERDK